MKRTLTLILGGAALVALGACAAEAPQPAPPRLAPIGPSTYASPATAFADDVRAMLAREAFADLDRTDAQLLSTRERFPGGEWKLSRFFSALEEPAVKSERAWREHLELLRKWRERVPNSRAAAIALGAALTDYAWKARGNGYASEVTEEGAELFHERVDQAEQVLLESHQLAAAEPQWYCELMTVGMAKRWGRLQVEKLFEDGTAVEPLYPCLYTRMARYLLPQWYGEEGEWVAFAEHSAARVGGSEGSVLYGDIAWDLYACCRGRGLFRDGGIKWQRIEQSFANRRRLYGESVHDMNVLAMLSWRAGIRPVARNVLVKIGTAWEPELWRGQAEFDDFRNWAAGM